MWALSISRRVTSNMKLCIRPSSPSLSLLFLSFVSPSFYCLNPDRRGGCIFTPRFSSLSLFFIYIYTSLLLSFSLCLSNGRIAKDRRGDGGDLVQYARPAGWLNNEQCAVLLFFLFNCVIAQWKNEKFPFISSTLSTDLSLGLTFKNSVASSSFIVSRES